MIWEIGFEFVWLHIKLTLVAILIIFHHFLARWRKILLMEKINIAQNFIASLMKSLLWQ